MPKSPITKGKMNTSKLTTDQKNGLLLLSGWLLNLCCSSKTFSLYTGASASL